MKEENLPACLWYIKVNQKIVLFIFSGLEIEETEILNKILGKN